MNTHLYKYIYTSYLYEHLLNRFDLEIHEVSHQECLAVDGDVTSH
jgi:hypothetical protein